MLLFSRFRIQGHSMEPTIKNGTSVVGTSILYIFRSPQKGDIVLFKKGKKLFVKRIKRINGQRFFLSGDNKKDSLDSKEFGWILREKIVGKVVWVGKKAGNDSY